VDAAARGEDEGLAALGAASSGLGHECVEQWLHLLAFACAASSRVLVVDAGAADVSIQAGEGEGQRQSGASAVVGSDRNRLASAMAGGPPFAAPSRSIPGGAGDEPGRRRGTSVRQLPSAAPNTARPGLAGREEAVSEADGGGRRRRTTRVISTKSATFTSRPRAPAATGAGLLDAVMAPPRADIARMGRRALQPVFVDDELGIGDALDSVNSNITTRPNSRASRSTWPRTGARRPMTGLVPQSRHSHRPPRSQLPRAI